MILRTSRFIFVRFLSHLIILVATLALCPGSLLSPIESESLLDMKTHIGGARLLLFFSLFTLIKFPPVSVSAGVRDPKYRWTAEILRPAMDWRRCTRVLVPCFSRDFVSLSVDSFSALPISLQGHRGLERSNASICPSID